VDEATEAPASPTAYYDVGTWRGLPHYECRRCPVDALDQVAIEMHLMRDHPELFEKPKPPPPSENDGEPPAPIPAESSEQEA